MHGLRRRLDMLRGDYHRDGISGVIRRISIAGAVPREWFCASELDLLRLWRLNRAAVGRPLAGYDIRILDESCLDELAAFADRESPARGRQLLALFFREHAYCAGVRHEGRLVGCCWAFAGRFVVRFDDFHSITLTLAEDEIVFGHGLIDEAHRLKGVFPQLLAFLVDHAPANASIFATVDSMNERSWVSHQRLGFVPEASFRYLGTPLFEHVTFKGYGARTWHSGLSTMPLALLRAHAPRSRALAMPIVATPLAQAIRTFFEHAAGVPFPQSLNWLSTVGAEEKGTLFVTFDGDRAVASSVVTEQPMPRLRKSAYSVQDGPLYADTAALKNHLLDLARSVEARSLRVEIGPAATPAEADLSEAGFVPVDQPANGLSTFTIALDRELDDLRAMLGTAARTALQSAADAGVVVSDAPTDAEIDRLLRLGAYSDPIRRMVTGDTRSPAARVVVATYANVVVAGTIALVYKDRMTVLPVVSSTAPNHRRLHLSTAVEWQAIQHAKTSALRHCDLQARVQPAFAFGSSIQRRIPGYTRISSPITARALDLIGRYRPKTRPRDAQTLSWSESVPSALNER